MLDQMTAMFGEAWQLNINKIFFMTMIALAVKDQLSHGKPDHKDFKASIVSLGFLGLFLEYV